MLTRAVQHSSSCLGHGHRLEQCCQHLGQAGSAKSGQAVQPFLLALQGEQWKKTTLQTALLFPGTVFAIFLSLNFLVWGQKSSGAVPFGTLFALCFLWFGISVPLVFVGSYFGYKKPAPEDPVRTNKIPRQIPEQVSRAAFRKALPAAAWSSASAIWGTA